MYSNSGSKKYNIGKYQIQGNRPPSGYRKPIADTSDVAKSFKIEGSNAIDIKKLTANEEDERYRYLLKHGIVRRVEDEDKIIFAELRQIPGVLVIYRKPSERNAHHDKLILNKRELNHLPLLEGEERLRLLNLQSNNIGKIENLVSLPNLICLDLYSNKVAEIQNLHTVPSLRVLMLGKNFITKIKGLDQLKHLEMLDLHTNKVTKIENIKHLSGLRVLNISNNNISAIENLNGLTSLNELNARKNIITSIDGLQHCPQLKKLFLSQNKIEMYDRIKNLKDAKVLEELSMESNPVAINTKSYVSYCFSKCTSLKILDGKKESEYRDSKLFTLEDGKSMTESTQPTPDKKDDHAGDDISPDNLLKIISLEWKNEMKRLKEKGLNGYKKRKDSKQDSCVQSGHAEIEGVTMLFIYGNAIEVLEKAEFQKSVEEITFQYMRFNTIVGSSNMKKLRKFEKLRKLTFSDNNIHSFVQISKLEAINTLKSITITNNDVFNTSLCRCFVVYRFPFVTEINGRPVTDDEKTEARTQFQNFDKILSTQKFYPTRVIQERSRDDSSSHHSGRNTRQIMKKENEVAHDFVNNLLNNCIKQDKVMNTFYENWEDTMKVFVSKAVEELHTNNKKAE